MSPARSTPSRKTASLLLRGVDQSLVDVFKARAARHGRSLQAELQLSLRREAHRNFDEALAISEHWQARYQGRTFHAGKAPVRAKDAIDEDRRR
jgi:plasmid stability protein